MSSASPPDLRWPSLGIVVPIYNEAATIERASREIAAVAEGYPGRAVVIAVDDGSADESAAVLLDLAGDIGLLDVQRHPANVGYGEALRTGSERARALGLEYVAFMDSDLTNPASDLLEIGRLAEQGHAYIKASRFIPGGGMAGVSVLRRWMSRIAGVIARALFGTRIRDVTNGFRAVRTELFCSWPLHEQGFAIIVEEFDWALRSGVEPAEFPTILGARGDQQRGSAFAYSPRLILSYLRYPMRAFVRRLTNPIRGSG